MSWIPLTDTVEAAKARYSAKSQAIDSLVAEQQVALRLRHWFIRPVVAMYFRGVRTVQYTKLCGLWIAFVALWCVRCLFLLGATAAAFGLLAACIDPLRKASPPSSGYIPIASPAPNTTPYPAPVDRASTSLVPTTYQPLPTPADYQPTTPTYVDPYHPPPADNYVGGSYPLPPVYSYADREAPATPQPRSKTWTKERKQMAKEIGQGLLEGGIRYLAGKDGGGSQDKVHVNGYYRRDGTYVRPYYRSYPSK
jgi:hypothetical protein